MDIDTEKLRIVKFDGATNMGIVDRDPETGLTVVSDCGSADPARYVKDANVGRLTEVTLGAAASVSERDLSPEEKVGLEAAMGKMRVAKATAVPTLENRHFDGAF